MTIKGKVLWAGKLSITKRVVNSKSGTYYYSNQFAGSEIVSGPGIKPRFGDWLSELWKNLRDVRYT